MSCQTIWYIKDIIIYCKSYCSYCYYQRLSTCTVRWVQYFAVAISNCIVPCWGIRWNCYLACIWIKSWFITWCTWVSNRKRYITAYSYRRGYRAAYLIIVQNIWNSLSRCSWSYCKTFWSYCNRWGNHFHSYSSTCTIIIVSNLTYSIRYSISSCRCICWYIYYTIISIQYWHISSNSYWCSWCNISNTHSSTRSCGWYITVQTVIIQHTSCGSCRKSITYCECITYYSKRSNT